MAKVEMWRQVTEVVQVTDEHGENSRDGGKWRKINNGGRIVRSQQSLDIKREELMSPRGSQRKFLFS